MFIKGKKLGEGSYGSVFKAKYRKSQTDCALKIISKSSLNRHPKLPKLMMNELQTLNDCRHPNIMRIFQLLEDDEFFYIASEFCDGGELFDMLTQIDDNYRPLIAG